MPGDAPPIHMIPEFDAKPIVRMLAILLLSPAGRILNDVRVMGDVRTWRPAWRSEFLSHGFGKD